MELACAMDLARSLSNEILGKLYKEYLDLIFLLIEALPIDNRFQKKI
jgi:hypothetical protein